MDISV